MKFKGIIIALAVFVMPLQLRAETEEAAAQPAASATGVIDGGSWNGAVLAASYYLSVGGNVRLDDAMALYAQAIAEQQWAMARMYSALADFYTRELYRIKKMQRQLDIRAQRFADLTGDLNGIVTGHYRAWTFTAIHFFMTQPGVDLVALSQDAVPALVAAENFQVSPNASRDRQNAPLEGFPGGNVFQLADFLQTHYYDAKTGSAAWLKMVALRQSILKVGDDHLAAIQKATDQLNHQAQDLWQPLNLETPFASFHGEDPSKVVPRP